jgi:hypothetical protein
MTEDPKNSRARHLRWREANPDKWKRMRRLQKKRYYARTRKNNRRRFKKWTADEDRKIIAKHRPTDRELSAKLGRSMQSIYRRRSLLRKDRLSK